MAEKEVRVPWQPLQEFTKEVFVRVGMPPEDAAIEAELLVWANRRGVDSHGVLRIPWYVGHVDGGMMNPRPNIQIEKETPATLLIEGDKAFGPVVTVFAMKKVMEKAKQVGIGWALLRNITHQGAMAYYSLMAAEQDMAGIVWVCSPPNMAPFGAKVPGLHNSPISIAVPARSHRPVVLDMATSVAAGGKLMLARDKGAPIPLGWALAADGSPTTDPNDAPTLLPAGGPKGSGLAMMFECLAGVMVGNPLQEPIVSGKRKDQPHNQNGVVAAIDISTFTDVGEYKETIDSYIDGLKALPKADGFDEIMVPGEPEDRTFEERSRDGIPLPSGTVKNLAAMAERFGIDLPPGI